MIPLKWRSTRQQLQPLKGQLFTFENFPVSRLVIFWWWSSQPFLGEGENPPKKITSPEHRAKRRCAPPKKDLLKMVKLYYTWVEETRETPLFGSSVFPVSNGIFFGAVGLFLGCKKLLKWCRWMKVRQRLQWCVPWLPAQFWGKCCLFERLGDQISLILPTLYIIKWWHDSSPTKGSHTDFKDSYNHWS